MSVRPDVGIERVIQGLEQELLEATDEEFIAGARDLGMNPAMKGTAAFIGVKDLTPQLLEALRRAYRTQSGITGETDADVPAAEPSRRGSSKRNADA